MRIAHISDIHCYHGTDFNEKVFEKAVKILNGLDADLVFISGDLTTEGLVSEYELAKKKKEEGAPEKKGQVVEQLGKPRGQAQEIVEAHEDHEGDHHRDLAFHGQKELLMRLVQVPRKLVLGNKSTDHDIVDFAEVRRMPGRATFHRFEHVALFHGFSFKNREAGNALRPQTKNPNPVLFIRFFPSFHAVPSRTPG